MDKASVKEIMKNPPMSRTDKNPSKAAKLSMSDNGCSTEVLSPKPQIVRAPKMNIRKTVMFTESTSSGRSPNESIVVEEDADNDATGPNVKLGGNDKMVNKEVIKLKKLVTNSMERRKKERLHREKVVEYMVEKKKSFAAEIEDLTIKLKLSRRTK